MRQSYFLPEGNFIWTSEKDGHNHIYLKDFDGNEFQLTHRLGGYRFSWC